MNVLIIGSGGREHALAWKVSQSNLVTHVFVAPGNAGTKKEAKTTNVDINPNDFESLIQFAKQNKIDLTIVGPEAPLAAGIQDAFAKEKLKCFAPNKQASQLESSKAFAKAFLDKHGIPTALSKTFNDFEKAKTYLDSQSYPIVIKADGLCAGKGVVIAQNRDEALNCLDEMLNRAQFKQASKTVVIEEFLVGEEASYIIITDGKSFVPFASSQDHKARDNGDKGPNTGGMGAYSPAPVVDSTLDKIIKDTIIQPTLAGLNADGIDYLGFLYVGLMMTSKGPKVLEFNCRLGDPEAQVLLMRLESDLIELIDACLEGNLKTQSPTWHQGSTLGVVMASHGYPQSPQTGDPIELTKPTSTNLKVFIAGATDDNQQIITSGGRVLCVCAKADDIVQAQARAYEGIEHVNFKGAFYRSDIGYRAVERLSAYA